MGVLTIAGIGCGGRTRTYMAIAARHPDRYRVVAAADPNADRLEMVRQRANNPELRTFASDEGLFAQGKLADVMIIGTQDAYHVAPAIRAMELGYDVLLEKPIATSPGEVLRVERAAERLGRRVLVCHVLRYTPFYETVKQIIDGGELGEVVSIDAFEGVGTFHQAHSFVRGHWSNSTRATPMIISKSCHDTDIISWMAGGRACRRVSSFGSRAFFREDRAPEGAPARCTDGCPVGDTCAYNALRYTTDQRGWLGHVYDHAKTASDEQIRAWLSTSPWGRCVYRCDNDVVDRQVVAMEFDGGVTATFTMTAFDEGRNITICGTRATLRGGSATRRASGHDIHILTHDQKPRFVDIPDTADGHFGGDTGLVNALDRELSKPDPRDMRSSVQQSVQSHLIGYAAEESRVTGRTVDLDAFRARHEG